MFPELDPLMRNIIIIINSIINSIIIVYHDCLLSNISNQLLPCSTGHHWNPWGSLGPSGSIWVHLGPEPWPNLAGWMAGSRASRPRGSPIEPAPVQAAQRRSWSTWKEALPNAGRLFDGNTMGYRSWYHVRCQRWLTPRWLTQRWLTQVDPSNFGFLMLFGIYLRVHLGTIWCHIAGKWSLSEARKPPNFPPAPSGTGTSGHWPGSGSRRTSEYIGHISSMSSIPSGKLT